MFSTILVPLDGSDLSARALPYAAFLTHAAAGRLILLHASSARDLGRNPNGETDTILDLYRLAERLSREGAPTSVRSIEGEAGPSIAQVATDLRADLLVMSTHGRGGLDRLIHGSIADYLLHHVSAPILMVTAACQRDWVQGRPLRILIPLDGSAFAEEAIGPTLDLARSSPVELWLLRAAEERVGIDTLGFAQREPASAADLAATRQYLEQAAGPLRHAGQRVTVAVEAGKADEAIAHVAEREAIDLVVMATHGRGGLGQLLLERMATVVTAGRVPLHLGSVATASIQQLHVPVLLVCPVDQTRPEPH